MCILLQTHRTHREEQVRLLEENAALKARIAAEAARVAMGTLPGAGVGRPGPKTFAAVGEAGAGVGGMLDAWLQKLERWVGIGLHTQAPQETAAAWIACFVLVGCLQGSFGSVLAGQVHVLMVCCLHTILTQT
jgi:hypothetical protein